MGRAVRGSFWVAWIHGLEIMEGRLGSGTARFVGCWRNYAHGRDQGEFFRGFFCFWGCCAYTWCVIRGCFLVVCQLLVAFIGKVVGFSTVKAEFLLDAASPFFFGDVSTLGKLVGAGEINMRGFLRGSGWGRGSFVLAKGRAVIQIPHAVEFSCFFDEGF